MRYASFLSILLHVGLAAAGLIAGPFLRTPEVPYVPVVPIEILSEAEIADELSVRADRVSEPAEEEEAPKPQRQPEPQPEPEPVIPPAPEPEQPQEKEPEPEPQLLEP